MAMLGSHEESSPSPDIGGAGSNEPRTLGAMILSAAASHSGTALEYKIDGRVARISYKELGTMASEIARGLIALGIEAGDRVAILGLTSAEWTLADCGALCAAAVVTPIYHTNSPEECAYVLGHSGARLVFCEDARAGREDRAGPRALSGSRARGAALR